MKYSESGAWRRTASVMATTQELVTSATTGLIRGWWRLCRRWRRAAAAGQQPVRRTARRCGWTRRRRLASVDVHRAPESHRRETWSAPDAVPGAPYHHTTTKTPPPRRRMMSRDAGICFQWFLRRSLRCRGRAAVSAARASLRSASPGGWCRRKNSSEHRLLSISADIPETQSSENILHYRRSNSTRFNPCCGFVEQLAVQQTHMLPKSTKNLHDILPLQGAVQFVVQLA